MKDNNKLNPNQTKRLSQWREGPHRRLIERVWRKETSRAEAIKAKCLDCVGEDTSAIRDCADRCCPLWHFRPYQTDADMEETSKNEGFETDNEFATNQPPLTSAQQ